MDVMIMAGRRGEALHAGRVVARIGPWDVRSYPGGDWEGSCDCEWYAGSDPEAFGRLQKTGLEAVLRLFDYNEVAHETEAILMLAGEQKMLGDVALLELKMSGPSPFRRV